MVNLRDRFIAVGDIRTRYWELGNGPPILLIHGLGASVETWQPTVPALATDHRVFALDLVGFGYTDKPYVDYTPDYLTRFILNFMDALELTSPTIVGHSLGGSFALRMAIDHGTRVDQLILVDSAGIEAHLSLGLRLLTVPFIGESLLKPNRKKTRAALAPFFYDADKLTQDFVDLNYELITQAGAQNAYLSTIRHMATLFGPRPAVLAATADRLGEVSARTLIIWGAQDAIVPVGHAKKAKQAIPDSELQIIEACGHLPMRERSTAFNQAIIDFLRKS